MEIETESNVSPVKTVKLVPSDGSGPRIVKRKVAELSLLVKEILEDDAEDGDKQEEIPLLRVSGEILDKILTFCEHYLSDPFDEIPKPIPSASLTSFVPIWYSIFMDEYSNNQPELYALILAANYMDVSSLLDLSCAKLASMMKGKRPAELKEMFGITVDFTPEEEEEIREANKWVDGDVSGKKQ